MWMVPNMFRFSSFCFWDYRVGLYSLCFKGEFQRYFDYEGFYMCFTDLSRTACALGRTVNTKYKTRQLISFARFTRRIQDWGEPKPWLIQKVVPKKTAATRGEANYQRRIYYSIALTAVSLQRQLQIKFNLLMRQTILWSTIYLVLTQAIFKEISWPEYWSVLSNKQSFWCFLFKFWIFMTFFGHWTLCDGKTSWNYENKCFYVETSLLRHCKSEKNMSNNEIMQYSYFYWKSNEKKADEKTTLFYDGICHDYDIAWYFWKNAPWDTIRSSSWSKVRKDFEL